MRNLRAVVCSALTTLAALGAPMAAQASSTHRARASQARSSASGDAQAPLATRAGGSEYGASTHAANAQRPTVSELRVPSSANGGRPPRVILRIDEIGVGTVRVRATVNDLSTGKPVIVVDLGWVHTGRALSVRWPASATLAPGAYHVSIAARDHHFGTLLRTAHSSGVATLTVNPPATAAPNPPLSEAGTLTPAESAAAGAVFPVTGAHSFGGPENRFDAPRGSHVHEGQDVLTSEGTPVVAPLAGTILTTSYQEGGAGYYAVEHTLVGLDFMFAHCRSGSLAVGNGLAVAPGQEICQVGQTGDATTPHLHFEIWVGGWQAATGHPIDPLPYLEAWDHVGA
jgi:murein DD-endopeptidase MepM/ murein hydrolase activator NlpD